MAKKKLEYDNREIDAAIGENIFNKAAELNRKQVNNKQSENFEEIATEVKSRFDNSPDYKKTEIINKMNKLYSDI